MGRYDNTSRNQYNSTPRKIFDRHVDNWKIRRQRDLDNARADMQALFQRMENMETQLTKLIQHVERHCEELFQNDDHGDTKDA